jgi:hypothetical protein
MELKQLTTTAGPILCLLDDRGTILGWIPYPIRRDAVGPGRGKVYLARPQSVPVERAPRAA